MKIKVKNEGGTLIEISIPYYCQSPATFNKIISETEAIEIRIGTFDDIPKGVQLVSAEVGIMQSVPCSEEKYNIAFEQAMKNLNDKNNQR